MRPIFLGVIAACWLSLPAFAAEPDGPSELITQKEALRIAVQGKLAQKAPARKAEQLAPYIAAALKRKPWMKPLAEHEIPVIKASVDRAQFARGAPPPGSQPAAGKEPKVQTG